MDNMLLSNVSVAHQAFWLKMEFCGTAAFTFPSFTMLTALIVMNTTIQSKLSMQVLKKMNIIILTYI